MLTVWTHSNYFCYMLVSPPYMDLSLLAPNPEHAHPDALRCYLMPFFAESCFGQSPFSILSVL